MGERKTGSGWIGALIIAILCFVLCWPVAYFNTAWVVYWGLAILSIIWALCITYIRTKYFWEE